MFSSELCSYNCGEARLSRKSSGKAAFRKIVTEKMQMDTSTPKINKVLFAVCGVAFALPSLFFAWYTVRLIYVNLTMSAADAAAHRTGGMLIGAAAFPLAAIIFALVSWYFFNNIRRSSPPV